MFTSLLSAGIFFVCVFEPVQAFCVQTQCLWDRLCIRPVVAVFSLITSPMPVFRPAIRRHSTPPHAPTPHFIPPKPARFQNKTFSLPSSLRISSLPHKNEYLYSPGLLTAKFLLRKLTSFLRSFETGITFPKMVWSKYSVFTVLLLRPSIFAEALSPRLLRGSYDDIKSPPLLKWLDGIMYES